VGKITWGQGKEKKGEQGRISHAYIGFYFLTFGAIHDADKRAKHPLQRHWGKPLAVRVSFTAGAVQHAWHWRLTGAFMG